jgi:hypothetical protein
MLFSPRTDSTQYLSYPDTGWTLILPGKKQYPIMQLIIEKGYASSATNLAWDSWGSGFRFEEAAADYRAVLAVAPDDPSAWNNLGNASAGEQLELL